MPRLTPLAAIRMSQATASSSPPPIAWPLMAATIGNGYASIASIAAVNGWATRLSASCEKASSSKLPMSYPAENTGPSPVRSRQCASCSRSSAASASRISWSSAPRFAALAIRIRATPSAGSSTTSLPDASSRLLKHHQRVALRDRLTLLAADLRDRPVALGLHRHLHLHRLEDEERVALHDLLSDFALDLPDGPGDVSLYVGQVLLLCSRGGRVGHDTGPCPWKLESP